VHAPTARAAVKWLKAGMPCAIGVAGLPFNIAVEIEGEYFSVHKKAAKSHEYIRRASYAALTPRSGGTTVDLVWSRRLMAER
jgi:hypothetical protein